MIEQAQLNLLAKNDYIQSDCDGLNHVLTRTGAIVGKTFFVVLLERIVEPS